jgi:hypothetical protein
MGVALVIIAFVVAFLSLRPVALGPVVHVHGKPVRGRPVAPSHPAEPG